MHKKKIIVIILTVVIFLSACVLGISTVYRVKDVAVNVTTVSEAAKNEAEQLKNRLKEEYEKQSTFFVDTETAEEVLKEFPYFRLTEIEKVFPNRLIFHLTEDEEVYAVATEDGYYILNGEGTILSVRQDYNNRGELSANAKNVLITGVTPAGEKGTVVSGDESFSYLLPFCTHVSTLLNGIRRNVISIEVIKGGSSSSTVTLSLMMAEGVKIYIKTPSENTVEKANKAMETYFLLSDENRTRGMIAVYENDGNVATRYSVTDNFE